MHFTSISFGYFAAGFGIAAMAGEFAWRRWVNHHYEKSAKGLNAADKVNLATTRNERLRKGVETAFAATAFSVFMSLGATIMTDKENGDLTKRVATLEDSLTKVNKRIADLENKPPPPGLGAVEANDINKLKEDIKVLNHTVDALVTHVTAYNKQFIQINNQLIKINNQIKAIDTKLKQESQRPQPG